MKSRSFIALLAVLVLFSAGCRSFPGTGGGGGGGMPEDEEGFREPGDGGGGGDHSDPGAGGTEGKNDTVLPEARDQSQDSEETIPRGPGQVTDQNGAEKADSEEQVADRLNGNKRDLPGPIRSLEETPGNRVAESGGDNAPNTGLNPENAFGGSTLPGPESLPRPPTTSSEPSMPSGSPSPLSPLLPN